MQKKIVVISVFMCVAMLASAKSKMPEWVTALAPDAAYYQGVGYAPKVKKSTAHCEQAYNEAVRALAAEVAQAVSASKVQVLTGNDQSLQEEFVSAIEARIQQSVAGCEKAATYEDKAGYWVLCRLSKQTYAQQQAAARQSVAEVATALFAAAENALQKNDLRTAIVQYISVLDTTKAYFNEPITAQYAGREVNLANESYNRINTLLRGIRLELPVASPYDVTLGATVGKKRLFCTVKYNGQIVTNFPVAITYTEQNQHFKSKTGERGRAGASFQVKSSEKQETLSFAIDSDVLFAESAANQTICKWLRQIPVATRALTLNIAKPAVYIKSHELNFGAVMGTKPLKRMCEQLLEADDYRVFDKPTADFELEIVTDTKRESFHNGIYTASLNAMFVLRDRKGNVVFSQAINNVNGTQSTEKAAGEKAYAAAVQMVKQQIYAELVQVLSASTAQ